MKNKEIERAREEEKSTHNQERGEKYPLCVFLGSGEALTSRKRKEEKIRQKL